MKWIVPAATSLALIATSAATAQTTAPSPKTPPSATAPSVRPSPPTQVLPKLTEAEAKALIDATVISSDDRNVGEVAAIQRDSEGNVTELHADIGGFLGIGQTRVRIMPSQFTVSDKQIRLTLSAEQVKGLPQIEK